MTWYNEPTTWSADNEVLHLRVNSDTDFWRVTHYDFVHDDGHFYYQEQAGDFVATVKVTGQYADRYDQAGLMIRLDEAHWIKAGIEYVEERQYVSAVVTRTFSDWSVCPRFDTPESLYLRLTRQADAVRVDYSLDDFTYEMLRLAYFPPDVPAQVGIMAAAPDGGGFNVRFDRFTVLALS